MLLPRGYISNTFTRELPMRTKNTELLAWLKTANDSEVAKTGTSRAYLKMIAYGYKTASAEIAVRTETSTGGLVTRQVLRPDDWHEIWPELKGHQNPCLDEALSHAS